jgi:hypothetical protein
MIVASSSGLSVRRSMTSALDPLGFQRLGRLQRLVKRSAIGDQADVGPLAPDRGRRDVDGARIRVDLPRPVVEHDVLEDQHRVGVLQRGPEHAARILDRGGRQHLQPRDMGIPPLEAVGMLRGQLLARAGGHADDQRHAELPARHVPDRGRRVHDLVERQQEKLTVISSTMGRSPAAPRRCRPR